MKPDPYDDKYLTFRLLLSDLTVWIEQAKRDGEDIQPMLDWTRDALAAIQKDPIILHPRPFFWRDGDDFGWINVPNSRTTEALLLQTPDALNALEMNSSGEHGPVFGFDVPKFLNERTRFPKFPFRTLREYLEAP